MNLIILLLLLVVFVASFTMVNRKLFIHRRKSHWLFTFYLFSLVSATFIYLLFIENDDNKMSEIQSTEIPKIEHVIQEKTSLKSLKSFLVEENQIPIDEDEITIQMQRPNYVYAPILVDHKKESDDTIDIALYQIPTIIDGIDITDEIEPIEFKITNNVLTFYLSDIHIVLNIVRLDFPFRQFTGEKIFPEENPPLYEPNQLIYLEVPETVDLNIANDININYKN